jgi:ABC-type transporter Mla maintaining outer membrane lipid asymmetry permease subunit MlaE
MAERLTERSAARQMVERALLPTRNLLEEVGEMMLLTRRTVSSALRPPCPYGEEFVSQFLFVLRLVWSPLLVTTFAISYGAPGLQAANFLRIFGAPDRINEEIDALEVMGFDSMTFLCGTRPLASWIVLPFMYIAAIGVAYLASYIAVVLQIGYVTSGGYLLTFWEFQSPPDLLFSLIKGMTMATAIVLVGCYGYNASGGPVGVGQATAKSMVLNLVLVCVPSIPISVIFWGTNPRAPVGG